jgi:hypothetical protein
VICEEDFIDVFSQMGFEEGVLVLRRLLINTSERTYPAVE